MNVNLEDSISDDKALKNSAIKSLLFTPKRSIGNHLFPPKQKLEVSLWSEMEKRKYPERVTLISNLIHDREAIMLYSPTGVGKTWLSLSIAMMVAGKGQLEVLDWENKDPQPKNFSVQLDFPNLVFKRFNPTFEAGIPNWELL